jgi:hypothetical protein
MIRLFAILCAVAATVLGNAHAHTSATGTTPAHAARALKTPRITKTQASAFARTVNLTAADVPGATATPSKQGAALTQGEQRELARCEGRSPKHPPPLVNIKSPRLSIGEGLDREDITSTVTVLSSSRTAAREVRTVYGARGRACLARILRKLYRSNVSVSSLAVNAPGAEASGGQRIATRLIRKHRASPITVYEDSMTFVTGPAEISLETSSVDKPVSATTERQLFARLLSRAKSDPI